MSLTGSSPVPPSTARSAAGLWLLAWRGARTPRPAVARPQPHPVQIAQRSLVSVRARPPGAQSLPSAGGQPAPRLQGPQGELAPLPAPRGAASLHELVRHAAAVDDRRAPVTH